MKKLLAFLVCIAAIPFIFAPSSQAQLTGPVQVYGPITAGHCMEWFAYGYAQDAGAACGSGGGGMVYPGAGIANSTGTAWGTSFTTTGSGSVLLSSGPTFTLPLYPTASLPACTSANKGQLVWDSDGSGAITSCNGTIWVSNGTTTFTLAGTGCTPTAVTGDATGGSFTLAAGPCTAVTVTFNGAVGMTAPHMWVCAVSDQTLQAAGTWFGEWGQSSSTATTATIPIPPAAGATDVVTFACSAH